MNKIIVLILSVFCISTSIFAQNIASKSIKLYINATVNEDYFRSNSIDALYVTPALVINRKDGDFWEFEVSHMKYRAYHQNADENRNIFPGNVMELELLFRAEFNHRFYKEKFKKLRPIIGLSVTPFFQRHAYSTQNLNGFPYSTTKLGAYLSVIPRFEYYFSERWFLDINVPIALVSGRFISEFDQSPLLLLEERRVTEFDVDNITGLGLRVGVGMNLL